VTGLATNGLMIAVLAAHAVAWAVPAAGAGLHESETVVLVAKRRFRDPLYAETIVIARPIGQDVHVGLILNKPTEVSLAQAFPGHGPSLGVRQPLYLGGPAEANAVFALVASHASPGRGSMQLSQDLFLVIAKDTVDRVIETAAGHARFFAGRAGAGAEERHMARARTGSGAGAAAEDRGFVAAAGAPRGAARGRDLSARARACASTAFSPVVSTVSPPLAATAF
jgi:putative transcriptional regulator